MGNEVWLPIDGFEGLYDVSSLGRVRSLRHDPPKILVQSKDQDGYPTVCLWKAPRPLTRRVHRLVGYTFHGTKRNILHNELAHLDGIRTNARADNLKWCSKLENHSHKRLHGTYGEGEKAGHVKLTEVQALAILNGRSRTAAEWAEAFGVSKYTVYDIWQGKSWRCLQSRLAR